MAVVTTDVYFDGLSEPTNPGFGSWGYVIRQGVMVIASGHGVLGWGVTNNQGEYTAAIEAVKAANARFPGVAKKLLGDSQLVVRQVNGQYNVNAPRIVPLYRELSRLIDAGSGWQVAWVPRDQNGLADRESRLAVWESLRKWPVRGRLLDEPPRDVPDDDAEGPHTARAGPRHGPRQATLGDARW